MLIVYGYVSFNPNGDAPCSGPAYRAIEDVSSSDPHLLVHLWDHSVGWTAGGAEAVWGVLEGWIDCEGFVGTLEREGVETVDLDLPRIETYCNESR